MKIIRFTSDSCQPCKTLAKTLSEIETTLPIEVVDVENTPGAAEKYKIRSVPTLLITEESEEISRLVGSVSKEKLQTWLKTSITS
jgi:thioredoxin-like negative regulator of GroEL